MVSGGADDALQCAVPYRFSQFLALPYAFERLQVIQNSRELERKFRTELHTLTSRGMLEFQVVSMKEMPIQRRTGPTVDSVAVQRVPQEREVYPYLMGTPCL